MSIWTMIFYELRKHKYINASTVTLATLPRLNGIQGFPGSLCRRYTASMANFFFKNLRLWKPLVIKDLELSA